MASAQRSLLMLQRSSNRNHKVERSVSTELCSLHKAMANQPLRADFHIYLTNVLDIKH